MRVRVALCSAVVFFMVGVSSGHAENPSFEGLVKILDGSKRTYNLVDKQDALFELARLNNKRAAKELARRLRGSLGPAAAVAMTELHSAAAVPAIVQALDSADANTRGLLCIALGRIGGNTAVKALVDRMDNDADKSVRRQAVYALRSDAQRRPAGPATKALVRSLKTKALVSTIKRVLWTVRDVRAALWIRKGLSSPSKSVRVFAIDWLRMRRDPGSTDALLKLLKRERNHTVRARATLALAFVHPPGRAVEVANVLMKGLENPTSSRALHPLIETLELRTEPFPPRLASKLARCLHKLFSHSDGQIAGAALGAAALLGHPSTARAAVPLLKTDDRGMLRAAIRAVGNTMTSPREARALLDALEGDPVHGLVFDSYRRLINRRKGVAKLVLPGLRSPNERLRHATASLLERLADPAAASALVKALKREKRRKTAEQMSRAILAAGNPAILPSLAPLLSKGRVSLDLARAFVHLDRTQGFKASESVIARGGRGAIALIHAAKDYAGDEAIYQWGATSKDEDVRREAASKLGAIDSPASMGLLCRLLLDKYDGARRAATTSLGKIHRAGSARCLIDALPRARKTVLWKESLYRALRRLSGEKFGDKIGEWREWQKDRMGLGRGVPGLAVALQSGSRERVMMAAGAAARLPAKKVRHLLPALFAVLAKEYNTQARVLLIRAVASARAPSSAVMLTKGLDRSMPADELIARAKALRGIGDSSGLQVLVDMLGKDRYRDRDKVAAALSIMTGRPYSSSHLVWQSYLDERHTAAK